MPRSQDRHRDPTEAGWFRNDNVGTDKNSKTIVGDRVVDHLELPSHVAKFYPAEDIAFGIDHRKTFAGGIAQID